MNILAKEDIVYDLYVFMRWMEPNIEASSTIRILNPSLTKNYIKMNICCDVGHKAFHQR